MAELGELLAPIPRPTPAHYRVRRWSRLAASRRVLFLVAIFLGTYVLMALPRVGLWGVIAARLFTGVGFLAFIAVVFAAVVNRTFRTRARVLSNNEGILLMASGRRAEATALYERLCRQLRGTHPYHALFVGNRGVSACLGGDFELGRALLAEAVRSGWFAEPRPTTAGGYFAAWIARSYALEGNLQAATRWREVATGLLPAGRKGVLLAVDAVLLMRAGHPSKAADAIAGAWMGAEGELPAHERRALRALHGMSLAMSGREAEVGPALAALWPPIPGELGYLAAPWPELAQFFEARSVER